MNQVIAFGHLLELASFLNSSNHLDIMHSKISRTPQETLFLSVVFQLSSSSCNFWTEFLLDIFPPREAFCGRHHLRNKECFQVLDGNCFLQSGFDCMILLEKKIAHSLAVNWDQLRNDNAMWFHNIALYFPKAADYFNFNSVACSKATNMRTA